MKRLEGKRALVTGGATGIGRAVAVRFAEEGADMAINYFTQSEAAQEAEAQVQAACQGVREKGCEDLVVQADVSDKAQVESMFGVLGQQGRTAKTSLAPWLWNTPTEAFG